MPMVSDPFEDGESEVNQGTAYILAMLSEMQKEMQATNKKIAKLTSLVNKAIKQGTNVSADNQGEAS